MAKSAEVAVGGTAGTDVKAGRVNNGVLLVGVYQSGEDMPELDLTPDGQAVLKNCGKLVNENHPYALRTSAGAIQILLANQPTPIVFALRPDGSLAGPGNIAVKGQAIVGYQQGYYGCPVGTGAANCKPTPQAVYGPALQRCTLARLAAQPAPRPAQRLTGDAAMFTNLIASPASTPVPAASSSRSTTIPSRSTAARPTSTHPTTSRTPSRLRHPSPEPRRPIRPHRRAGQHPPRLRLHNRERPPHLLLPRR